ncbi:MAG TPA: hypothetical protein VGB77_07190 [Abditibacteriaceae bacterium]|jgi:hypothetical protein
MNNEFDLGPVLDDKGKPVEEASILALALEEKVLPIKCDGLTYKAKVQRNRVPYRLTQMLMAISYDAQQRHRKEAGFTEKDMQPGGILSEEGDEDALANDPRWVRFIELQSTDETLLKARANLAASAIIASNAPGLTGKEKITGDDLLKLGRIGEAVTVNVANFIQSSKRELSAAGENKTANPNGEDSATPTKANTNANSNGSPGSKKGSQRKT